jgi:hypothetical protein
MTFTFEIVETHPIQKFSSFPKRKHPSSYQVNAGVFSAKYSWLSAFAMLPRKVNVSIAGRKEEKRLTPA